MDVNLSVISGDLVSEDLQNLTRDLCKSLEKEADLDAKLPERPSRPRTRGEPITIGAIVLTALSSGTAVALFNVLKSYFERRSSIEFEFQREDGKKLKVRSENVQADQIGQTIELAREFFGESP